MIMLLGTGAFAQSVPATYSIEKDSIEAFRKQNLKTVQVVGRKKNVEQKIDKTIINVDASATNTGTSALEVLEKSPGVQVDKDGNISLKGKQGVTILVDGRPTYLNGEQLASMLKGIESSQLEQIEIMTNPPSKYDAAGNSGVINIKTKKNKTKGFNGNISAGYGQGKYPKTNESISLNYRAGKINLYANYGYSQNTSFRDMHIYRRYINDLKETRAIFDQQGNNHHERSNNNLKLGMDYYLNKKTTMGIVLSGFTNPETDRGHNTSFLKDAQGEIDSIVETKALYKDRWKNGSINLNLRHTYDSTGRELDFDIDAISYGVSNNQQLTNIAYTPLMIKQAEDRLLGDLPMNINIYSAKSDYTHPLKKQARIEAGWKSSYVVTDSKAKYYNIIDNSIVPDYTKTNFFRYKENINAAYINYNKQITAKFSIQAGLRFENTNYSGLQYGNPTRSDSSFTNTYNGLFPTAYFSYNADKNNVFALSAGRRIDRPQYEDLNPFLFFIDRYTYGSGNPYLKPQYSNNFELTHIFKGILTTVLNYSHTKNMFSETFDQAGDYASVQSNGNIGRRDNFGIAVSAQFSPAKWLSTNIYTNYNYTTMSGILYGEQLVVSAGNFNTNITNQFNFNKGWGAELSGWYNTKNTLGQIILHPMGSVNAAISKQVLKGKGSVKLNARDIFYTQPVTGDINFKTTQAKFNQYTESRVLNLTFTYRFGKLVNTPQRKERSSEEQGRVKGAQ
jgi:iron complex outermembrane receptor protein